MWGIVIAMIFWGIVHYCPEYGFHIPFPFGYSTGSLIWFPLAWLISISFSVLAGQNDRINNIVSAFYDIKWSLNNFEMSATIVRQDQNNKHQNTCLHYTNSKKDQRGGNNVSNPIVYTNALGTCKSKCRDDIIDPIVLPFLQQRNFDHVFQHDNARCHVARVCQDFLKQNHIRVLPCGHVDRAVASTFVWKFKFSEW
jgi:hypothetical protein